MQPCPRSTRCLPIYSARGLAASERKWLHRKMWIGHVHPWMTRCACSSWPHTPPGPPQPTIPWPSRHTGLELCWNIQWCSIGRHQWGEHAERPPIYNKCLDFTNVAHDPPDWYIFPGQTMLYHSVPATTCSGTNKQPGHKSRKTCRHNITLHTYGHVRSIASIDVGGMIVQAT
jgi:hypothetical protein